MKPLLNHYLRLDARSLGLFRFFFGLGLLFDLRERWHHIVDFYSNDGVLPNHNHIFVLKNQGRLVWSALHAFSTSGEAWVAFAVIAVFYSLFAIGWKTRAFQVLSLVSLVSLSARNTLAEGPGEALGIAILAITMFLPLGSRFSVDAFLRTWDLARDAGHEDLNRRDDLPSADAIDLARLPGWAPRSIAAFGVLVQLTLLMIAMGIAQKGAWREGTALHRALSIHLFASPTGFAVRDAGFLGVLGRVVYWSQWAIPALLLLPIFRGPARLGAAVLLVIHGLTYHLFTNLGLFGWTIAASAFLVVSSESWDRWATKHVASRVRTVIYDVDCGVCYQLCKILRRWDTGRHLVFQGNDFLARPEAYGTTAEQPVLAWDEKTSKTTAARLCDLDESGKKRKIDEKVLDSTVLAVAPSGRVAIEGAAIREVLAAVPGLRWLGLLLGLPVLSQLVGAAYRVFAPRRAKVSVELGLAACGVPTAEEHAASPIAVAPSTRLRFRATSVLREVFAFAVVLSLVHAITHSNEVGWKTPDSSALATMSWWMRTSSRYDIMAPEPPMVSSRLVLDAITRSDQSVDLMTGRPSVLDDGEPFTQGSMWARYAENIRKDEARDFQAAFKTYTSKRGPAWDKEETDARITGVDALWVTKDLTTGVVGDPERLFRHGRGGKLTSAG
ncbi:MAG TPA: DCC1-like thiol-disulfide oxidoreductase family protein, partial [Polyangiaceae bacterium]|nr:DCC1-like thiol-disulfide oxidoreductase family protein [Polyangiaceae bacterium]